jgi:hypothetical protein
MCTRINFPKGEKKRDGKRESESEEGGAASWRSDYEKFAALTITLLRMCNFDRDGLKRLFCLVWNNNKNDYTTWYGVSGTRNHTIGFIEIYLIRKNGDTNNALEME